MDLPEHVPAIGFRKDRNGQMIMITALDGANLNFSNNCNDK